MERLRRYPRIADQSRIVLLSPELKGVLVNAETRILGMGGCLVATDKPIDVNREYQLSIYLGKARFTALGKVLYKYTSDSEPAMTFYGIKFTTIKAESRELLKAYIDLIPRERDDPATLPEPRQHKRTA